MNDLKSKLNVIKQLIRQCEQSKLVSFSYQDTMFSIRFSKESSEIDYNTNAFKKVTIGNDYELKIGNIDICLDENVKTDISQVDKLVNLDIVTIVSPFVGVVEFSNQIKLGGSDIHINKGDVICSVEAMKIYNDIKAPTSGTIVEILVDDCSLIEFEQPILKIRVDKNE